MRPETLKVETRSRTFIVDGIRDPRLRNWNVEPGTGPWAFAIYGT